jgi:hypothetical protein
VFATVWGAGALVLRGAGVDPDLLSRAAQVVAVPLWFLAVYVGVVALAPLMVTIDTRYGWRVPVTLTVLAASIDVITRTWSAFGWINFLFVWLSIHQLGIRWATVRIRLGVAAATAAIGLAAMATLTVIGPYPVSMVGVPGAGTTNNSPPTVALVALAAWQFGLAMMAAGPARRLLTKPAVWAAVIAGNARIMTIYLWHMTAMVAVIGLSLLLGGIGLTVLPLSTAWWMTRPLWFAALGVPLVGLIWLVGRFERSGVSSRPRPAPVALMGMLAVGAGFALLALKGFADADGWGGVAVGPVLAVFAGARLLGVGGRAPSPA